MHKSYLQTVRTIENPPIPVLHELESSGAGLTANAELIVQGTPCGGSKKGFAVEFLGHGDIVAFHMNPRFKFFEYTVVINSTDAGGRWQKEERHNNVFRLDQQFTLQIFNYGDHFKIVVNNKDYCTFRHRIPTTEISKVKVHGDVRVHKLQLIMMVTAPSNPAPVNYPPPVPPQLYDYSAWQAPPPSYAPPLNMPHPPTNPSLASSTAFPGEYPPSVSSFYPSLSQNTIPNIPQAPAPNDSTKVWKFFTLRKKTQQVSKLCKRFKIDGTVTRREKYGRPKKQLSEKIVPWCDIPKKTSIDAIDAAAFVNETLGVRISAKTTGRRLKAAGLKARRLTKY